MKWITKITVRNYRAFGDDVPPVNIPCGSHMLIYGENGSGKSSLFGALRDFFSSTGSPADPNFHFEEHRFAAFGADAFVELSVEDDVNKITKTYRFSKSSAQSNNHVPDVQLANKVKGFLDYKRMLRVHALDVPRSSQPNVFKIMIKELLADHSIPDPYGSGISTKPVIEVWDKLFGDLCNHNRRTKIFQEANIALGKFNIELQTLLQRVITKANDYLGNDYFKTGVVCHPSIVPVALIQRPRQKKSLEEQMYLGIQYNGQPLSDYHYFLNEARLSAVAMSIHLAALKENTVAADTLKLLYLDDVFIGLDTSNRIPLLKILEQEFISVSGGSTPTQIILSTYDRHWYETARLWLESVPVKLVTVEMYVETPDQVNSNEKPLLITPGLTYAGKAKQYYAKHDYPAAANSIRKACEAELKRILPRNLRLKEDAKKGTISEILSAEELFKQFENYATTLNIDLTPFNQFRTYKKILFNALSHDDSTAPHFRKEIEEGLIVLQAFQKIKIKLQFTAAECAVTPFRFKTKHADTCELKTYIITPLEDLVTIKVGSTQSFLRQVCCKVKEIEGTEKQFHSFNQAHDAIWKEQGYTEPTDYVYCRKHSKITSTKTMESLAIIV